MQWWEQLTVYEHILFVVALASTIVVATKIILTLARFYMVDKLNSEPEEIEEYESVANSDPEMKKHIPGFISIFTVNVFLASACWAYFIFELFMKKLFAGIVSFFIGVTVLVIYAVVDYNVKKQNNLRAKKQKN